MGYREWRERQIARVDAMTARAETRAAEAKARAAEAKAREVEGRERRAAAAVARADGDADDWMHRRARALHEDHDDLVTRAAAVGMSPPVIRKPVRVPAMRIARGAGDLGLLIPTGVDMDGGGGRSYADDYEAWRDRIVIEEMCASALAENGELSVPQRMALKIARLSSK